MRIADARIGVRVRFQHPTSNGGLVTYSAEIVRLEGDFAWVEIPERVRSMPFPPLGGKRYGKYVIADMVRAN